MTNTGNLSSTDHIKESGDDDNSLEKSINYYR